MAGGFAGFALDPLPDLPGFVGVHKDNQVLIIGLGYLIFDLAPYVLGRNGAVRSRAAAIDGEAGLFRDGVQVIGITAGDYGNRVALIVVPAQPFDHQPGEVEVL